MLPKNRRVSRHIFQEVVKKGQWAESPRLSLRFFYDPKRQKSVFAVSVSAKVLKTAVKRNLFKRRVRYILRELMPKVSPGIAGVFFLKKGAQNVSFEELKSDTLFLLQRSKILK